jgi:hypothetical protein
MLKLVAMDRVDSSRAYLHLSGIGPTRKRRPPSSGSAFWGEPVARVTKVGGSF